MAKLHVYRKVNKAWSKQADGDGTLNPIEEFGVTLTSGSVTQGTAYQIRQGQSPDGAIYDCTQGAANGETARFRQAEGTYEVDLAAETSARAVRDFRSAFLAAEKTISIEIDLDDLKVLKASNYKLCFAKKVGAEAYNVVWQSYMQYLAFNHFSWTPTFQLFVPTSLLTTSPSRSLPTGLTSALARKARSTSPGSCRRPVPVASRQPSP